MDRLQIIMFIVFVLIVLVIANAAIYRALISIFSVQSGTYRVWLGVILALLSLCFIASNAVGSEYYNAFSRIFYQITAIWMGLFAYLFLASILYGILNFFLSNPTGIGKALILVSIVAIIYGIFNAKSIYVNKIDVAIPNLPSSWENRTIVWMSDLHLGQINGPEFAERMTSISTFLKPDIIFVGGDLFDGGSFPEIVSEPLKNLNAPLGVFYITGNHEEFGDNSKYISTAKDLGMKVLMDEKIDLDGMQIVGVDYENTSNKQKFQSVLERMSLDKTKPSILLKHEPKDLELAEAAGISFTMSGHTHRAQMWPFSYIPHWIYKGFDYGLHNLGNMQVFTSSGAGTWGPPIRVGTQSEILEVKLLRGPTS